MDPTPKDLLKTKTNRNDSEHASGQIYNVEDNILLAQGHQPILQRTFSWLGGLGLGFSITNSWLSYASCFGQSLRYGGPQTVVFGLLVACVVQWIITLGLAEQASAFPSSGGQYHFAYILAPERHKRFAAFNVGILSVAGWWIITCSGISNNVQSVMGIVSFLQPDFEPQQWQRYLLYIGFILVTLVPIFTIPQRHMAKWTQLCLALSIIGFAVTIIVLLVMCDEYQPASHLTRLEGSSGWQDGVAWLMSVGNAMYAFASTDAVIHVAEEMHHPGKEIPRIMNMTMLIGIITGMPFTLVLMVVVKSPQTVGEAVLPSLEAFYQATGSKTAAVSLQSMLTVLYYTCMPSQWITCGRLAWAFSRDHGLPYSNYWNHVDGKYQFPVRTTLLSVGFCTLYGALYLASTSAFNTIIITAAFAINVSYCVPQAIVAMHGRAKKLPGRPLDLGNWGYICNIFAPIWVILLGVFICFPSALPVSAGNMNYVCVVLGALAAIFAILWWLLPNEFLGPKIDWEQLNAANALEIDEH